MSADIFYWCLLVFFELQLFSDSACRGRDLHHALSGCVAARAHSLPFSKRKIEQPGKNSQF
jgi:hypothetical protein